MFSTMATVGIFTYPTLPSRFLLTLYLMEIAKLLLENHLMLGLPPNQM